MINIVFTGGGTAGHVYPAKPLVRQFIDRGFKIYWLGSRTGMEKDIAASWNIEYVSISTGKLRRYFSFKNFSDLFRIAAALFQSMRLLKKLKPAIVFSKGGFVSVPPVVAARLLGIPAYTHDSDFSPGLATRINNFFCTKSFVACEESKRLLGPDNPRVIVSGNPVRRQFFNTHPPLSDSWKEIIGDRRMILVLGGSSGARQINDLVLKNLGHLCREHIIIHQMGDKLFSELKANDCYIPVPYIYEDLPALLKRADFAISRAGAGTLWELAVSGTPSLLIPLTRGSRGDQVLNARGMKKRGMSFVLEDEDDFLPLFDVMASSPETLDEMRKNCLGLVTDKAEDIIMACLENDIIDIKGESL